MTAKLTQRQADILAFVRTELEQVGRSPTIREIRDACGISSTSVVDYNVGKMEGLGVLTRLPEISRSIRPVMAAEPEMEKVDTPFGFWQIPKTLLTHDEKEIALSMGKLVLRHIDGRKGRLYFQEDIEEGDNALVQS